jgi:site-specific DNA recombinase
MFSTNGRAPKRAVLYMRVSGEEQKKKGYSLSDQREALRVWCGAEGYEVLEEVEDGAWSGAYLVRPGLDRVRDLVEAGDVDVVVTLFRDRLARGVYAQLLKEEFAEHGTKLVALNAQLDDSPEGELHGGILDQFAAYERAKIAERTRRGKLRRAREGKILPVRRVKYGFKLNTARDGYVIHEEQMVTVRRIFSMVGVEGMTHNAVMRILDREGVPTPGGGKHWDRSFFRACILDDVYRPHGFGEVEALVTPEVAARLDPEKRYGIWWFNRLKTKTKPISEASQNGRRYRKETRRSVKSKDQWIAVPVPDAGIPREVVDAARERIKDNRVPSTAGRRFWELSGGIIRCGGCGRRMGHHSVAARSKNHHYHYYRCAGHNQHLEDCRQVKNVRAGEIESAVWGLVSELLMEPEILSAGLEEMIERERRGMRGDPDREAKAWAEKLAEVDRKRSRFQDMAAEGLISFDELKAKLAELEENRNTAQCEMINLEGTRERIWQLEQDKARLLEDFANLVPEAVGTLTGEERNRLYSLLRLRVTVQVEGDVEVRGAVGDGFCLIGGQPRSTRRATGASSSVSQGRAL